MRELSLRTLHILVASLLVAAPLLWFNDVIAAQLSSRSVQIGSSDPSATTNHLFSFTVPSVTSVGSIAFEYCINGPQVGGPCTAPTGLDVSSAILQSQTGESGFVIDAVTTTNRLVISRAPSLTSAAPVTYNFTNIINQSTPNETAYVRIATYATTDATGSWSDEGAVAYSTARPISVSGFVPPYITFCAGVTVALNCTSANGTQLSFGELSKTQANTVTSQFSVATNDPTGYTTTLLGTTMTSGNNIITALASPSTSQPGQSQFGINLVANGNPPVGAGSAGIGTGTPRPNFANPNQFYFNNEVIAGSPLPSDFTAFTVSYLVNVGDDQPAGVYTTTLTYVAMVSF